MSGTSTQAQLKKVRAEIAEIHATQDPERVQVALRLAGLQQRMWDMEALAADDVAVRLSCSRQSAMWGEQVVRCAKAVQVDLLRDLFAKSEAMQRHQSSLRDLK